VFSISCTVAGRDDGDAGAALGELELPTAVVVDPITELCYVSEMGNSRVSVFDVAFSALLGVIEPSLSARLTPGSATMDATPNPAVLVPVAAAALSQGSTNPPLAGQQVRHALGHLPADAGRIVAPTGIAVDGTSGVLYLVDRELHYVTAWLAHGRHGGANKCGVNIDGNE